jgi:hypothetical protein
MFTNIFRPSSVGEDEKFALHVIAKAADATEKTRHSTESSSKSPQLYRLFVSVRLPSENQRQFQDV